MKLLLTLATEKIVDLYKLICWLIDNLLVLIKLLLYYVFNVYNYNIMPVLPNINLIIYYEN